LRPVPRNFPGRSGTREDSVYLCSPETATAAALTGEITDPRDLEKILRLRYPRWREPEREILNRDMLLPPGPESNTDATELVKGPNIRSLPDLPALPDQARVPALLKLADDVPTDAIPRAGAERLPSRSNIP